MSKCRTTSPSSILLPPPLIEPGDALSSSSSSPCMLLGGAPGNRFRLYLPPMIYRLFPLSIPSSSSLLTKGRTQFASFSNYSSFLLLLLNLYVLAAFLYHLGLRRNSVRWDGHPDVRSRIRSTDRVGLRRLGRGWGISVSPVFGVTSSCNHRWHLSIYMYVYLSQPNVHPAAD